MIGMTAPLMLVLSLAQVDTQERARIPEDSVELTVVGCLKGRVLTTIPQGEADVQRGVPVGERTFWLTGKRDVMNEVKKRNKQLVEVVGLVKRSSLDDTGVKAGRISIAGGAPVAGTGRTPTGAENVPVIDATAVRQRGTSCDSE